MGIDVKINTVAWLVMEISEEIGFSLMAALICVFLKMLKGAKVASSSSKSGECLDIKCAKTFCVDPIATYHPQTMFHPRTTSDKQENSWVIKNNCSW